MTMYVMDDAGEAATVKRIAELRDSPPEVFGREIQVEIVRQLNSIRRHLLVPATFAALGVVAAVIIGIIVAVHIGDAGPANSC
ncbi:hypothetical protein [Amycolatopsis sp.]|uniref:hypothetical protein n=1 Tax=Amycolatopsis sp. TaxID=37632 RepID=UPI002D0E1D19|nr:hypothetical protein [Amycolatopsis sp.]HVV09039.1 hypothetical protein [Amycolatopsis sp.]